MIKQGGRSLMAVVATAVLMVTTSGTAGAGDLRGGPPEGKGHATLEEAVVDDLGMSVDEFAALGAEAELATEQLEKDPRGPSLMGVRNGRGVQLRSAHALDASDGVVGSFATIEEMHEAYVRDVGEEGLTGMAYTETGLEIMVTDPDRATERGRGTKGKPAMSPARWGKKHGVTVSSSEGPADPAASLRGGSKISFGSVACTHGFNGYYKGKLTGISAGHCAYMGGSRVSAGSYVGTVNWWQFGAPGSAWESYGTDFATYPASANYSYPASIVKGGSSWTITGWSKPILGMPVCKQGRVTGWTCSTVNKVGWQWIGDGSGDIRKPKRWVYSAFADMQVIPGDSGGPWVTGHKALGVTSSYDSYSDGRPYATAALIQSLHDYRPGMQVRYWIGTAKIPSVTYSTAYKGTASWSKGEKITGKLGKLAGDTVIGGTVLDVYVDGTRVASPKVYPQGSFSFIYPGSNGVKHTVTLKSRKGYSRGSSVTVIDGA